MYNLDKFSEINVLVIGDVMIDKYLWGEVRRISPEAPVPVVNLKSETAIAGGAANVAANIAGLRAKPYLIGLIGNDADGDAFGEILRNSNVSDDFMIRSSRSRTIVKTRIMAHNQQIARLDQELISSLTASEEQRIFEMIDKIAPEIDIVVISDYGKGLLSNTLLKQLIKFGAKKKIPVMIDPKGRDYLKYKGATLITPNKFELAEVCGCSPEVYKELEVAGMNLLSQLELEFLIVTRGEDGIALLRKNGVIQTINSIKRKVYDVTGAGDTFISTLAVAYAAELDLQAACELANTAAGLVVEELGTTVISLESLKRVSVLEN